MRYRRYFTWAMILSISIMQIMILQNVQAEEKTVRYYEDNEDEVTGESIHLLYVVPFTREDKELDINGAITRSIVASQKWFYDKTGYYFKYDTYQGNYDITFISSDMTDYEILYYGPGGHDIIANMVVDEIGIKEDRKYSIFYGGDGWVCAAAKTGNQFMIQYMEVKPSRPDYTSDCSQAKLTSMASKPDYRELTTLHETMHMMGAVPDCAPNVYSGHHVDDPNDLMNGGRQKVTKHISEQEVDVGNDDYFNHDNEGCLDVADSSFLTTSDEIVENYEFETEDEMSVMSIGTAMMAISILIVTQHKIKKRQTEL